MAAFLTQLSSKSALAEQALRQRINRFFVRTLVPALHVQENTIRDPAVNATCFNWVPKQKMSPNQAQAHFLAQQKEKDMVVNVHAIPCETFHLNAVQIYPETIGDAAASRHIVYFSGNQCAYEFMLIELQRMARAYQCHAWGFNYRGVSKSEGVPESLQDFIADGQSVVQFLLSKGVPPENIILRGLSLGGAVSIGTTFALLQKQLSVNVFVSRTFSTTEKAILGHYKLKFEYPKGPQWGQKQIQFPRLGKYCTTLARPLFWIFLYSSRSQIDFSQLYLSLPAHRKDCMVSAAPNASQVAMGIPADFSIHDSAKFEHGLEDSMQRAKTLLMDAMALAENLKNAITPWHPDMRDALTLLQEKLRLARAHVGAITHQKLLEVETRACPHYYYLGHNTLIFCDSLLTYDMYAPLRFSKMQCVMSRYSVMMARPKFTEKKWTDVIEALRDICDHYLMAYKMCIAPEAAPETNAHNVPFSELQAICNPRVSGEDYFKLFFDVVGQHVSSSH